MEFHLKPQNSAELVSQDGNWLMHVYKGPDETIVTIQHVRCIELTAFGSSQEAALKGYRKNLISRISHLQDILAQLDASI